MTISYIYFKIILKSNEDTFKKIFFLLFPQDDDFTVLFWSASFDRPCINQIVSVSIICVICFTKRFQKWLI
jgi:hypothetical protein